MREGRDGRPLGSVLVLGAGIGGMQTALELAESGYLVHLVTREPSIGGHMARLDKTFPTNDCAMCMLGPKMTDCLSHPNIDIHTCAELSSLEGTAGDFRARLRFMPRFVDVEECTACGECEEVCPVELGDGYNLGMNEKKAISKFFPQAVPNKYYIEKRGTPPCRQTCPAGTNAQGYIALISQGKFTEALEVVRRRMPFAAICGRICHHPCEAECNRLDYDDPLAIAALKRAAADYGEDSEPEHSREWRGERVAVVGAGPAGLTAALDLVRQGFRVTVYDRAGAPGGMMRSAIPRYRLSEEVLDREIEWVLGHGIEFEGGTTVGEDVALAKLRDDYDAVLLAVGTQLSRGLRIDGADHPDVLLGLDFLKAVNSAAPGEEPRVGRRVLVIGGGNVAIDAARSALRLGADEVRVACLESRAEMPAHEWEIEEAAEEGVVVRPSWGPKRIVVGDGRVVGAEMLRCSRVFDEEGRFDPVLEPGTETMFEADTVILAIGQAADLGLIGDDDGIETERGAIRCDGLTLQTSAPDVFACGDVVSGPASVVEAVAAGHEAAESIRRFLFGEDLREGRPDPAAEPEEKLGPPEGVTVKPARRQAVELEPAAERRRDFREVSRGFTREQAVEEASRCLNCGGCSECLQCEAACEKDALRHDEREREIDLEVGAVVAVPGYSLHDAAREGEYGYGIFPNVVTSLEFERLLSSTGPTEGELCRPSDGGHPRRIAFIQCVGSRDTECGVGYCSTICCMYSTKEAIIAREHDPDVSATIFYIDVRAQGKGFDAYVESAKEKYGVRYVRSMVSSVKQDPATKNLRITYATEDGIHEEEFDLVVLAVGVRPPSEVGALADVLGIDLNEYGFAKIDELAPVDSSREGVLVAGAFRGPQDIPETVMTASAAAARVGAILSEGRGSMVRVKEYPPERDVSGEEPRVGVFVCHCGINIASVVSVEDVVRFASGIDGVVHAEGFLYTCSQDSLKKIQETIKEKKLNRVVVASCTVRTHRPLFQDAIREAGLNRFLFEMANIRDQCSWVHKSDPGAATAKAKTLVSMAVEKVKRHEPLELHPVPVVKRALVVGGGPAGMTAALNLSSQGFEACIVEREGSLGGRLNDIGKTLFGTDVSKFREKLIAAVDADPRITVMLRSELKELGGHAGHFVSKVARLDAGPDEETVEVEHGVVIVASGARESVPDGYMYGEHPRVLTGLELERRLSEGGRCLDDVDSVAFIQCVGSRCDERPYCSRTCCGETVKAALEIKRLRPDARIYVLYRDVRTYGFMEPYYREARERGVVFVRYDEGEGPSVSAHGDRLVVRARDPSSGLDLALPVDLLVLAAATEPSEGTEGLALSLRVPLGADGFFMETHAKLGPMDFPSQGLFLCGSAHGPKYMPETVYQALGASARAATILSRDVLMAGGVVAVVDETKCAACLTCVRTCPYQVPRINEDDVAEIDPVQCQGCGTCAGECPAQAITLCGYTNDQLTAKVAGLFAPEAAGD